MISAWINSIFCFRYVTFPVFLWLSLSTGVAAQSGASTANIDSETLLGEVKRSLMQQALNSGLNITSAGYIDSSGRLVESTYFNLSSRWKEIQHPALDGEHSIYSDEVAHFLESVRDTHCENFGRGNYKKTASISVENAVWPSGLNGELANDIIDLIDGQIRLSLNSSNQWNVVEGIRNAAGIQSTAYRSLLNQRNGGSEAAEYFVNIEIKVEDGTSFFEPPLRTVRHISAEIASDSFKSRAFDKLVRPKYHSRKQIRINLSAREATESEPIVRTSIKLTLPKVDYNLLARKGKKQNSLKIAEGIGSFVSQLSALQNCGFKKFSVKGFQSINPRADKVFRMTAGTDNGVAIGQKFVASHNLISNYDSLLDPDILNSLVITEVIQVNKRNSELKVIAGSALGTYTSAIPF